MYLVVSMGQSLALNDLEHTIRFVFLVRLGWVVVPSVRWHSLTICRAEWTPGVAFQGRYSPGFSLGRGLVCMDGILHDRLARH